MAMLEVTGSARPDAASERPAMTRGEPHTARRFFAAGLLCLLMAAASYGALIVMFGPRPVEIHVRWAPDMDSVTRRQAEQRYHLSHGAPLEETTWTYTLGDLSRANIMGLVSDELIEDTQDIDRATFRVSPSAPRRPYLTSRPWIPDSLPGIALLSTVIGFISIALGLTERRSPGTTRRVATAVATNATTQQRLALLLIVVAMGGCFFAARAMGLRADERSHLAQINRFAAGDYTIRTGAMIGFHAVAAVFGRMTGSSDRETMRLFALLISAATIFVFSSLMRVLEPRAATMRTLQFGFFPLLFPFWFLIYTDVFALLLLLLAVLALTQDRIHRSGIMAILSTMVRQTHIVWLAMLGLWTLLANAKAPLPKIVRRVTSFGIGAGLFLLFIAVNGGVAIADKDNHPEMGFHTGNLLFLLVCFFGLFLPLILSRIPRIVRLHPGLLAGVFLASGLLYFGTFRVDHPWNSPTDDYFLRNRLLDAMTSSPAAGVAASAAIALAVLTLCVIRLKQPINYLVYPFAAFSVMPIWLIEQRYYLPAFALWMVFRESASPRVEAAIAAFHGALAVFLFVGVQRGWFFL